MLTLGAISFAVPWALTGLLALPVIWWLLKLTPPLPTTIRFPPVRLLFGLGTREESAAQTPLWLLIVRSVLAALVILCRELLVSGLREFLAEIRVSMPVSRLAKWKTFIQMFSIGFLMIGDIGPFFFHPAVTTVLIGEILIWIAAALTLVTGYDYLRTGWRSLSEPEDDP